MINENLCFKSRFNFKDISETDIQKAPRKQGHAIINTKVLKESSEICNVELKDIQNYEISGT